jgi:hypothetical protein
LFHPVDDYHDYPRSYRGHHDLDGQRTRARSWSLSDLAELPAPDLRAPEEPRFRPGAYQQHAFAGPISPRFGRVHAYGTFGEAYSVDPEDYPNEEPFDIARKRDIKQFDDAVRAVERAIGRPLDDDQRKELHDEITRRGYGYHEIIETGKGMFGRGGGGGRSGGGGGIGGGGKFPGRGRSGFPDPFDLPWW